MRERKKTWNDKVKIVKDLYSRCREDIVFSSTFYQQLFFLNPKAKTYFKNTDWEHQHKALIHGLDNLLGFLDDKDDFHRKQILRLAGTHAKNNLNIHPHLYYYWIDAFIITCKKIDPLWYDDQEYYIRECLFFPISFMISLYHGK
jgi:hemoglobin-like flavoprotein